MYNKTQKIEIQQELSGVAYLFTFLFFLSTHTALSDVPVERFGIFEATFESSGQYSNPFIELEAEVEFMRPDGSSWTIPLFWDGGSMWNVRVSPDVTGTWSYTLRSADHGLDGRKGTFTCVPSNQHGSIQPMTGYPQHFQYQDGSPMWFMGDTAWALPTDNEEEKHHRESVEEYLRTRADQGFNVVHTMLLSEAGWGNAAGLPFEDMTAQIINPGYWQEVDQRVAYANSQGLVVGLAIAWADKRKQEPFAWRMFPNLDARKRYARYIIGRYAAYDVYFLVSGEWQGEVRTRRSTEAEMKREFTEIGDALKEADPHNRMIGIHPMTQQGSVREFNEAAWMSFGDYQQNYHDLHARLLQSRRYNKPLVNSEYGYHLRDKDGDGVPDKRNSTSLESIRNASWDIVMAGGYLVTGFGTTYFGGYRDPGPFNIASEKNEPWEREAGVMKRCFESLDWWKLEPYDAWLTSQTLRDKDSEQLGKTSPPNTTYWLLAEPGRKYLAYTRGLTDELTLQLGPGSAGLYRADLVNPRSGTIRSLSDNLTLNTLFTWRPPDNADWVLVLTRIYENRDR